ncbi:MAG: translation initiation factor Sui1 [Desulfosarcina sp.]|nr:translation initiation factor Sui1 [Desulfobacterales bacterium]
MLRRVTGIVRPPKNKNTGGLVYSTESGRMCPDCRQPVAVCDCRRRAPKPSAGDGVVRVGRETKGRKGKGVTTVTGVPLDQDALKRLAKQLKQQCGTGGTVKNGIIEIQGDHRERLMAALKKYGWVVKRAGG